MKTEKERGDRNKKLFGTNNVQKSFIFYSKLAAGRGNISAA